MMAATSNSAPGQFPRGGPVAPLPWPAHRLPLPRRPKAVIVLAVAILALVQPGSARAAAGPEAAAQGALRSAKTYAAAQASYLRSPSDPEAGWQLGRACFDLAEFATNDTQRAEIARQGIAVCRQTIARVPGVAPGRYYLAMNLGQLARTRSLGALKIVGEMEREFKAARDLDEHFDFAGPDRNLGLLYLEAPGWPTSIGSRGKARQHLQRAVELAPEYPDNRLNLLEAYLKWSDRAGGRRELTALEVLWPIARTNFPGEAWAMSWADWDARLGKARKKIAEPVQPLESPRTKG